MPEATRLLHVEDDDSLRTFVGHVLQQAGFTVESVSNGLEALKTLAHQTAAHDLVILDLVLPWVNGIDVLAKLRSDPATRKMPVLITTGTMVSPKQFAGDRRVSVLKKPFDEQQILVAVESLLYAS